MPNKQTEAGNSEKDKSSSVSQPTRYGLEFRGIVGSVDQIKEWKDYNTGSVLGTQCSLGLSDKKRMYTYTLKIPSGQAMPEINFGDELIIENAGCNSDKGQHRLTGDYLPL